MAAPGPRGAPRCPQEGTAGRKALATLRRVLNRIEDGPLQFPLVMTDIRRALMGRFPFGVFFFVDGDAAVVMAVMHLHRNPDSWEERR